MLTNNDTSSLMPELLIISGLQVVSKRLKSFLRKAENMKTWRIGNEEPIIDTYQQVDTVIKFRADMVYKELNKYIQPSIGSGFQNDWLKAKEHASEARKNILNDIIFSDLRVFADIFGSIPEHAVLELGNSSVIRYSQLFDSRKDLIYYSNRGVSGIDGCLSAAVGTALATDKTVITIVGDLSFIYDSNALWNKKLPANLRIIVINNQGGGIFRLIDGPQKNASFTEFVNAHHPVKIEKLAEAFGLKYFCAGNEIELKEVLKGFYKNSDRPLVMEIVTSPEDSAITYKRILGN